MTRRPIFIGIATILALGLTASLAHGAGRLVGTTTPGARSARQQVVGTTSTMRGIYSNHAQVRQPAAYGSTFRSQMRDWMQNWMANHGWSGQSWGPGYGHQGTRANAGATSAGYSNRPGSGYTPNYQPGRWNGPANSGYGCCGYGNGGSRYDHDWHDCW